MGQADSDKGGSGSGPGGLGGGGGSSSSGGRGGGFDGRDTPGHPGASDGRRGSSMGPDGGRAPGGSPGRDTPGHPGNPGRRGTHRGSDTPGHPDRPGRRGARKDTFQTARDRAKDALNRHRGEGLVDTGALGLGKEYSHAEDITERSKIGAVHPREMEMARGYKKGKDQSQAETGFGGLLGSIMGAVTGLTGIGAAAQKGVGELAGSGVNTPAGEYGRASGYNQTKNNTMQSATEGLAGALFGPVGGIATGFANTAINDKKTADIDRMSEALGFNDSQSSGSTSDVDGIGGGKASTAIAAMSRSPGMTATRPPGNAFGWSPVDIGRYSRGPLSMARNS